MALGGDLEGAQALVLASTSPQRRAILERLRIPFVVRTPHYVEHDPPDAEPVELVREHARGKARSVEGELVLGVDTTVVCDGRVLGKAANEAEAREMLGLLAGRMHEVVSGLCLVGRGLEMVEHEVTRVFFRPLSPGEIDRYVASGEWAGRAGAYAIQGFGATLVERIEGDYLNVVGLPGALLLRMLAGLHR